MNVHALDARAGFGGAKLGRHAGVLCLAQKKADRMEQKCSRPAGGVEHMPGEGPVNGMLDYFRGEPIGRVIFAKPVALLAVNQRFVEVF